MDKLTRDLLENWGLSDYIGTFCVGKIDAGTLRLLTNDEISQLIPVPGERARFKANLSNWKKELRGLSTDYSLNATENAPTLSIGDLIEEDPSFASLIGLGSLKETAAVPSSFISPPTNQSALTPLNPVSPSTISDRPFASLPTPLLSNDRTSTPIQTSPQQIDYVLQTLKHSNDGKAILSQGQKTGKLDESQRNLLVKLIIGPLFESNPDIVISNNHLLRWALEIQDIFPNESAALYYTPYVSALVRTTARNASGKLLRFVYNKRRQLREKGIIKKSSRSSSTSSQTASSTTKSTIPFLKDNIVLEEIEEKLTFLKNTLEPWHLVEEYWTATANYRLTKIYSEPGTLQEYFNEFSVLKQPAGYNLLLRDFEILFEDKLNALFINIASLQPKIIELAQKKVANLRDRQLKQTIENYLSAVTETASNDVINNACLLLLPFITSSVPLRDKKKSTWRPSKTEVRDGFITQIGAIADLEATITSRICKLHRFGKSLQPFVVFVGTSISEISECYVIVGNTYYKFDKLLTAVDVCYKVIHATGAQYQEESYVIWMIIQKAFYRMHTEHDKELTTIHSLLVDLGIK